MSACYLGPSRQDLIRPPPRELLGMCKAVTRGVEAKWLVSSAPRGDV
jgi:hypothetical protein